MFGLFKKKQQPTAQVQDPTVQTLTGTVEELKKQTDEVIRFTKSYTETVVQVLSKIEKLSMRNAEWSQEFHRLLINEYTQYPVRKVYGIIYANTQNLQMKRMVLVAADTFEKANNIGENILQKEGENPQQWRMETQYSLNLPDTKDELVAKVDAQMSNPQKPIGVFVNDLKLIRDKFATKDEEKALVDKIIKRIERTHAR